MSGEDPFSKAAKDAEQGAVDRFVAEAHNHPAELDAILADKTVLRRVKNAILKLWGYHVGQDKEDDEEE